jgi:hypothetical protein
MPIADLFLGNLLRMACAVGLKGFLNANRVGRKYFHARGRKACHGSTANPFTKDRRDPFGEQKINRKAVAMGFCGSCRRFTQNFRLVCFEINQKVIRSASEVFGDTRGQTSSFNDGDAEFHDNLDFPNKLALDDAVKGNFQRWLKYAEDALNQGLESIVVRHS